jgi:hypothetical protein
MREGTPGHLGRAPARWHAAFEEPWAEEEIEVDLGDCRVRRGVHYSRCVEAFLDDDSGAVVPVVMWRYASATTEGAEAARHAIL